MKLIKQIPNALTIANLLLGIFAIITILESSELVEIRDIIKGEYNIVPNPLNWNKLALASFLIILAGIFDFFDGFLARILNAQSEIGKQLDSLADLVTFGVAPSIMLYKLIGEAYSFQNTALGVSTILLWPGLLIAITGAIRLAKFNISTEQSYSFIGLPIPGAAMFIISLPLILLNNPFNLKEIVLTPIFLYCTTIVISYLMISNVRLMALKFKGFTWKDNSTKYIFIIISTALVFGLQFLAIPIIIFIYIITSLLQQKKLN